MYRYIGDTSAYNYFNYLAFEVLMVTCLFFYPLKRNVLGVYTQAAVRRITCVNEKFGNIVKFVLASIESLLIALVLNLATYKNASFGELVGTGANYYATILLALPLWFAVSFVLMVNPLKQIDIATLSAPLYLSVAKIACFCHGCCWGISWENGLYNSHPDHPGNQVPVQLMEAICALAIFIFLLFFIKKAKAGTVFPTYVILYSITRFPIEFFSAAHKTILGPFNAYHFLCIAGVLYGILLLVILKKYGDRFSIFFDSIPDKFLKLKTRKEEQKSTALAEEQAKEAERLEKVRLAREKAKARRKR